MNKFLKKTGQAGLILVAGTSAAYADLAADVATAQTAATSGVTAAVGAVIAVAAIGFGVSMVVGWIRK